MSKKSYSKKKYKKPIDSEISMSIEYGEDEMNAQSTVEIESVSNDAIVKSDPVSNVKKWFSNFTSHQDREGLETINETFIDENIEHDNLNNDIETPNLINNLTIVEEDKIMESKKTIIAEGVEITGNMTLEGDLELFGKIKGNINSKGDIVFAEDAQMEGSLVGNNFTMQDGNIDGNVQLQNHVMIGAHSQIIGDIHALSLVSSGKILGNIFINDHVILNETSVIEGNIKAKQLEVRPGAIIKGQIEVN